MDRPKRGWVGAGGPEAGHLLVVLMVGVTVMLIMLTTAAQSWTFRMRREAELELIFRGEQYVKALEAYRSGNGGAFPVGDLKILGQKGPLGFRYIRKLYSNPFDPNGAWQYLYLHPGGSGFINPCATSPGLPGTLNAGQGDGRGFPAGGSMPAGAFSPLPNAGTPSLGGRGRGRSRGAAPDQPTSAMDPNIFRDTGIASMTLPIVGVVNCEAKASIRIYMGQTWLNHWAFTPLAQGQFAGTLPVAGGNNRVDRLPGGLGMSGAEVFKPGDRKNPAYSGDGRGERFNAPPERDNSNRFRGNRGPDRSWRRDEDPNRGGAEDSDEDDEGSASEDEYAGDDDGDDDEDDPSDDEEDSEEDEDDESDEDDGSEEGGDGLSESRL